MNKKINYDTCCKNGIEHALNTKGSAGIPTLILCTGLLILIPILAWESGKKLCNNLHNLYKRR